VQFTALLDVPSVHRIEWVAIGVASSVLGRYPAEPLLLGVRLVLVAIAAEALQVRALALIAASAYGLDVIDA
jgi:hypothetical protein